MKVAGKLTALLGLPLLIIFSIFASGVYCGATRADRVVELEQRWLGVDPPPGRLQGPTEPVDAGGEDAGAGETGGAQPEPAQPEPAQPEPAQPEPAQPEPAQPAAVDGLAVAKTDPVGSELRKRFEEVRVVRVQIMVDPALVVAREDWLGYIARLFEATRASYELLFGIELQLHGVVVWDTAVGADASELLADLAERERDGADVMLGLLAREQPSGFRSTLWTEDETGDHALVFADLQQEDRYYRNLLRALALLFGAEPATDSAAKQLGSFMSDSVFPAGAAPVLDPENRGRVIINKRRSFVETKAEANPDEPDEEESEAKGDG